MIVISVTNSNFFNLICRIILIMELNMTIQFSTTYFISAFGRLVIHSSQETLSRKRFKHFRSRLRVQ